MWDFELVILEKTEPPVRGATGNWYRYIIANEITQVSGRRKGSRREVNEFIDNNIKRLNTRHRHTAGSSALSL